MRKQAKLEAKMRKFADGSRGSLSKGKHPGKKIKVGHHAAAGKNRPKVKRHKMWRKKTG